MSKIFFCGDTALKGFWEEIQVSDYYRSSTLKKMFYNLPNIKARRHSQVITDPKNNVIQLPPTLHRHFEMIFFRKKSVCLGWISKYGNISLLFYPPSPLFYWYHVLSRLRLPILVLITTRFFFRVCVYLFWFLSAP